MTKEIQLTQGMVSIIDDEDYEMVSSFKWCVAKGYSKYYGSRTQYVKGGGGKKYQVFLHNFIMGKPDAGFFVDHINGDGLDNRRCNLRIVNRSQNRGNAKKTANRFGTPTSSKYKGVCWHKKNNRWQAQMKINNKMIKLGSYKDELDAARAYNVAAYNHWGEFALLNEVD